MKIADIELGDKPLFLAPMEDVTDPSFRYMCKRFGADVVYTEFIPSDGLVRDAAKAQAKLRIDDAERPRFEERDFQRVTLALFRIGIMFHERLLDHPARCSGADHRMGTQFGEIPIDPLGQVVLHVVMGHQSHLLPFVHRLLPSEPVRPALPAPAI